MTILPINGVRVRDGGSGKHTYPAGQNGEFGPETSCAGRRRARHKSRQHDLIPEVPTQRGAMGIRFDFNCGARLLLPQGGEWHVRIWDTETATVFVDGDFPGGMKVYARKKYYIPYALEVRNNATGEIWRHAMDLRGQPVSVFILVGTIGDVFAWFPYCEKFAQAHGCDLHVCFRDKKFKPLFRKQYPGLKIISDADAKGVGAYAAYMLALWWADEAVDCQPYDHRFVGLAQTAGFILGVDPEPVPPRLDLSAPRRIAEPYVCVAAQSSTMSKNWQHPTGWADIVHTLKRCGYRVLCIDREREVTDGEAAMRMPEGAEDFTGNRPLQERIDLLKDADFFIGMASGLAWVAWACGIPVVMIGGFSHPYTEFPNPYRVINPHFCNSCWNDTRLSFDHHDWRWCPRHEGTEREHECMKQIQPEQVMRMIARIPAFQEHLAKERSNGRQ